MRIKLIAISIILFVMLTNGLHAQESIVKDYVEGKATRSLCFYPSTLRMINLKNNEDFNELVSTVEKLLLYVLDSTHAASGSYLSLISEADEAGFEEYASMSGGSMAMYVLGKTSAKTDVIGVLDDSEKLYVLYLKGLPELQKIPALINAMQTQGLSEFLNEDIIKWR